jgi:hypothetical protein
MFLCNMSIRRDQSAIAESKPKRKLKLKTPPAITRLTSAIGDRYTCNRPSNYISVKALYVGQRGLDKDETI